MINYARYLQAEPNKKKIKAKDDVRMSMTQCYKDPYNPSEQNKIVNLNQF